MTVFWSIDLTFWKVDVQTGVALRPILGTRYSTHVEILSMYVPTTTVQPVLLRNLCEWCVRYVSLECLWRWEIDLGLFSLFCIARKYLSRRVTFIAFVLNLKLSLEPWASPFFSCNILLLRLSEIMVVMLIIDHCAIGAKNLSPHIFWHRCIPHITQVKIIVMYLFILVNGGSMYWI